MDIAVIGTDALGLAVTATLKGKGVSVDLVGPEGGMDVVYDLVLFGRNQKISMPVQSKLSKHYECVIFAGQTQDISRAFQQNCDYLEEMNVLTLQNGVQAENLLSAHIEKDHLLAGMILADVYHFDETQIEVCGAKDWLIGKPYAPIDPFVHKLRKLFDGDFTVSAVDEIIPRKWLKLLYDMYQVFPALIGLSIQETYQLKQIKLALLLLIKECMQIVSAARIVLQEYSGREVGLLKQIVDVSLKGLQEGVPFISEITDPHKGCGVILENIQLGKVTEIDFFCGEFVALARNMRMPASLNERILELVHAVESSGAFFSPEEVVQRLQIESFL